MDLIPKYYKASIVGSVEITCENVFELQENHEGKLKKKVKVKINLKTFFIKFLLLSELRLLINLMMCFINFFYRFQHNSNAFSRSCYEEGG